MKRRILIITLVLLGLAALQGCWVIDRVGGDFTAQPVPVSQLSSQAQTLITAAYRDVEPNMLRDVHTHLVGLGTGTCDTAVTPKMLSWAHPIKRIEALVYESAAGIADESQADAQYKTRLFALIDNLPVKGKFHFLAFDWAHDPGGVRRPDKSTFFVANDCIDALTQNPRIADQVVPVISVHPYRKDAVQRLKKWAAKGVRYVKWLPNAHGIDASDPAIDDFYKTMIRHDMILLTHVGEEKAVEADADQLLGNPLCFRRPLDMGLKVIMAHAGGLGVNKDLDNPVNGDVLNFELFARLMKENKYRSRLFGEISAMTQFNRMREQDGKPPPLVRLIQDPDIRNMLATRFVNGSDYPLPAINALIWLDPFVDQGLITEDDAAALKEIYRSNPLLFDFTLKRTMRWRDRAEKEYMFPLEMFQIPAALEQPYPESLKAGLDDPGKMAAVSNIRCR